MRTVFTLFLLASICSASPALNGETQTKPVRRVLIFYELGLSAPSVEALDSRVRDSLESSPFQIELYREYLETTLFPDPKIQQEFREWYIHKYRDRKPDLIIALGESTLRFMVDVHDTAFPDVPIVFGGTDEALAENPKLDSHFTGVWERFDVDKTLEAALRLQPSTRHVVVTGGTSAFDRYLEGLFREKLRRYEGQLDISYLTELDFPTLLQRLKQLPENTLILHCHVGQDSAGTRFSGAAQVDPLLAKVSNAPIFSPSDVDMGHGEVGGYIVSFGNEGQIVGEMAVRILQGTNPKDIPIVTGVNAYVFDWLALRRWGFKEKNLPPGSIVLNQRPTVWDLYKWYIVAGVCLLLVQTLLIVGLLWQRANRRKAEGARKESENRLAGIVTTAMDAIIAIDAEHRIVLFNLAAEKMFGCLRQEVVGTTIERFIPERFRGKHAEYIERFGESGVTARLMTSRGILRGVRRNGEEFPIEASISHTESNGAKLFTVIIRDITERLRAEEALSSVGRRLLEAHEEERTWIGRELHDDINQKLAMLAIEMEQWTREESRAKFMEHLRNAKKRIMDLSLDVQALSHRLHSSKLDYLGLTVAASSFCREVSEKAKVEVQFRHSGVPSTLPKEVSLCLFRVLQEALQNAIKYSGVRTFRVDLRGTTEGLELSVSDAGKGFDEHKCFSGEGLGLISMRERLQMVHGVLDIKTQPGAGTTIYARVHLQVAEGRAMAG